LKQAASENELAVKEIQVKLKEEIVAIVKSVEERLREEQGAVDSTVRSLQEHSEASLAGAQRIAGELQTQLSDFEGRYSGLVSPGAQTDKGPLRDWLLAELREAIKEAVRDFKVSLQVKSM
jgi:hypothetical protein